ncbi:DUF4180 domain-containing protein [Henriciella litoralis]|uniref:DUF4180 domain-containing protein n=1 Tax=Henriciella litoralis TaxID=568102 RepID=UPI00111C1528|nr:DUF4180 domain-containing protein [Henriciella litoralis]
MTLSTMSVAGTTVLVIDPSGPKLGSEADAASLLSDAFAAGADWIAIPVARLDEDFFELSNRKAGFFLQKIINYQRKVAIVGDVSGAVEQSNALRDFVRESNRGRDVWFAETLDGLRKKLEQL